MKISFKLNKVTYLIMTNSTPKEIRFYSNYHSNYEFTNFAHFPIKIDKIEYQTNEHYFQAMKFFNTDKDHFWTIVKAPSPKIAKELGNSRIHRLEQNWDSKRNDVMRKALEAKFSQYPKLTDILLATEDAILIEDNPWDYYWGNGGNKTGKNMLGILLMELRENIKLKLNV